MHIYISCGKRQQEVRKRGIYRHIAHACMHEHE